MGAAIGAATGNAGAGAAIGGGAGLLGGTAMGSNAGASSEYQLQRRYDIAYQQCMYAKGNQIPGPRLCGDHMRRHRHRHHRATSRGHLLNQAGMRPRLRIPNRIVARCAGRGPYPGLAVGAQARTSLRAGRRL